MPARSGKPLTTPCAGCRAWRPVKPGNCERLEPMEKTCRKTCRFPAPNPAPACAMMQSKAAAPGSRNTLKTPTFMLNLSELRCRDVNCALPPLHYPQGESNPCLQDENLISWASRRWGLFAGQLCGCIVPGQAFPIAHSNDWAEGITFVECSSR